MNAQSPAAAQAHPLAFVPNVLTIGRIVLIPFLVAGIIMLAAGTGSGLGAWLGRPSVIFSLFILAAITDFLDGFLARRWKVTSDFGRMIDPIADKLLVAGCLIAFCIITDGDLLIIFPALAIIGRDILVSGVREHAALMGRVMPPTNLAKFKTAAEMLGIGTLILWAASRSLIPIDSMIPPFVEWAGRIGLLLIWVAAVLSVYTGALYLRAGLAPSAK
jgi:CDP-diacylglycerol--glycerol-3-phosphate 3-phosphatidyltransferase